MIKHIIFDWGGVLEPDSNWHTATVLSKRYNCDKLLLYETLDSLEQEFATGQDDWPFYEHISDQFNIPIRELHKELNNVHYRIHMIELINKLFKRYSLHILSNQMHSRAQFILEHEDIHYFKEIFFSSEIHFLKPHKKAYLHVIKKLRAKPEECLFIDDREVNVQAARSVGMHALHYRRADILEKDLKEMGILKKHVLEE